MKSYAVQPLWEGSPPPGLDGPQDVVFERSGDRMVNSTDVVFAIPRDAPSVYRVNAVKVVGPDGVPMTGPLGYVMPLRGGDVLKFAVGNLDAPVKDELTAARQAYLSGEIEVEEFERRVHGLLEEFPA